MRKLFTLLWKWKFKVQHGYPMEYELIHWIRLKDSPGKFTWAIETTREGIHVYYLNGYFHRWDYLIENCEWSADKATWRPFI